VAEDRTVQAALKVVDLTDRVPKVAVPTVQVAPKEDAPMAQVDPKELAPTIPKRVVPAATAIGHRAGPKATDHLADPMANEVPADPVANEVPADPASAVLVAPAVDLLPSASCNSLCSSTTTKMKNSAKKNS
jgi:hypothetical protein